ncbi:hypothetical protein [Pyxidicoccus xibeiensis]|uniref:hypothetical protein n=1 Tax=Pyxidicoccus xibeiensis TaxID=2906759 RepID=UPI0020A80142|nr:hypothetical protein [Pyxidicoccus xibeiensis]MCP3140803.1 hypothetical protein [Pyxidicoccus xibeiensis]
MIQLSDREIRDERLELNDRTQLYSLGQNLTLRRCTLVVDVPARFLSITGARLIDCTIDAKRELVDFRWEKARLEGCRFTGRLNGNDFGSWPYAEHPQLGGIEDCDFTAAHLDGCRFIGCDVSTLRLPAWPCFTLLDPVGKKDALAALQWPGQLGAVMRSLSRSPPTTAAVTLSASRLLRDCGVTPDAFLAALERLDGVIM